MIRTDNQYIASVDEFAPAPVAEGEGWRRMDIRFLATADTSGIDRFCVWRTVFPPGARHERHYHPNAHEFFYVVSGRAAVGAGDEEHLATRGTVQVVPAGKVHWLRNLDPDEPVEVVGAYVGGGSLEAAGYVYVGEIEEEHAQVRP